MKPHLIFVCLSAALATLPAQAGYELQRGSLNQLWQGNLPNPASPPATAGQFSSVANTAAAAGPVSNSVTLFQRYPANAAGTLVLQRASFGTTFAAGVPRYSQGDEITPPLTQADGVTPAPPGYWRARPVMPGDFFQGLGTPVPMGSVVVTASSTDSASVEVQSVPAGLVLGATLLGQPVTRIEGRNIQLAGNASAAITAATVTDFLPPLPYYYSPHAEKVFAHQPGRVEIKWVTSAQQAGQFLTADEIFAVSANTIRPVRTIYWTEGAFDGPAVAVNDSRVSTVNPLYNNAVPKAVAEEVVIPGRNSLTPNRTTLSFDKVSGAGLIRAYNVEGRLVVEYLGARRNDAGAHEHLGLDVVEIKRNAPVAYPQVYLGQRIVPSTGDLGLIPRPVTSTELAGASYYGSQPEADQSLTYYAERETSPVNMPDNGEPRDAGVAYNKVVFYWMQTAQFGMAWPTHQDRYWLRWSPNLDDYAHYTVDAAGSGPDTGITFPGNALQQLTFQDDPAQTEARIDSATQRFVCNPGGDGKNRALLKFTSEADVWYLNIYTQTENRSLSLLTSPGAGNRAHVNNTAKLEVGMVVSGGSLAGSTRITRILSATEIELSASLASPATLSFTVESLGTPVLDTTATVGTRIEPPAGHEIAGYISGGTGYYPAAYINPFAGSVPAASLGAIIPVNAAPGNNRLTVRWFRRIPAPTARFSDLYVPGKVGRYTVSFPASTTPEIVIAQGLQMSELPAAEAAGSIYYQNNPALPGFNPNEEHAFFMSNRACALRDDLNILTGTGYTSAPCVLVAYTSAVDGRPAMHAYNVKRSNAQYNFDYTVTAGAILSKPWPLGLLPNPLVRGAGTLWVTSDREVQPSSDAPANTTFSPDDAYRRFTFEDRKGGVWVHRGPHNGGSPAFSMKLYYVSRDGFYIPGMATQPAAGTILPFLREASRSGQLLNIGQSGAEQTDAPLSITYRPQWPQFVPELRVGETLALPKFGLPQVRGQSSAQVLYQQSLANAATATAASNTSVVLHDPTRGKTHELGLAGNLDQLPSSLRTASFRGKTYFQGLPPHLQQRLFLDPSRGPKGTLVFTGGFHDAPAGEDYFDLNLFTAADLLRVQNLASAGDIRKSAWDNAVASLVTRVETFGEDPRRAGTYIPVTGATVEVGASALASVSSPDAAVDSYALTATGKGTGYVTMVFGNGRAFTDEGDPVQIKVFKVAPQLYTGDLKVIQSSNPLDEQVTLRHSGDFAGRPGDYEFEWRWASAAAGQPAIYNTTPVTRIGNAQTWKLVSDPNAIKGSTAQYAAAASFVLPRTLTIREAGYTGEDIAAGLPGAVLKCDTAVDFSSGVPGDIWFSADIPSYDGFVLYVNGTAALAYNAPQQPHPLTPASSGLTAGGLPLQFAVSSSYFTAGPNILEVALYTASDPAVNSSVNFRLEAVVETDAVTSSGAWQSIADPTGALNTSTAILGGSADNPFAGPAFVLNDRWFTMRYRPKAGSGNVLGTQWSRWMPPMLVEGWVKRVLAAINPFEQRVKNLYSNAVNTDVSVLTQAGARWEGDIALNLDNINGAGLIEIYETVLNRARAVSIDANTNDPDSNSALLLAAGYLSDLYTLLGNEAFADAANPTISVDDQASATQINTSRFSFEGQVATSLEEELALLRGRDDFSSPGVNIAPAYNRLYWNYTRGINSGEAIYALNYNIREKLGSSNADGVIDETDAQRMFPQGHGDAYGHYLTALTGYYRLLSSPHFTWTPRAETVTVLGVPVDVDYMDERKFAAAAGNIARTAQQIIALTWRKQYRDAPEAGWAHFRDSRGLNPATGVTSRQGMDEWISRSAQGTLYHWATANAMLPVEDTAHEGIQKIDRTTVPELKQLAAACSEIQSTSDSASAHLNPLGLSPGAIAFDISASLLKTGGTVDGEPAAGQRSHYEQIAARAVKALNNAAGAFQQAAEMTGALRNQENSLDAYQAAIYQQEHAFTYELIDVFGRAYSGDIGPGRLYAQGYTGPDFFHWFIVDRPMDAVDTGKSLTIDIQELAEFRLYDLASTGALAGDLSARHERRDVQVTINPSSYVQYNDVWLPGGLGSRAETGTLQESLLDAEETMLRVNTFNEEYEQKQAQLLQLAATYRHLTETHISQIEIMNTAKDKLVNLRRLSSALNTFSVLMESLAKKSTESSAALAEALPKVLGLANDTTSGIRSSTSFLGAHGASIARAFQVISKMGAGYHETQIYFTELQREVDLEALGFSSEEMQLAYEFTTLFNEVSSRASELMSLTLAHQRALQRVQNEVARGLRVLEDREIFRQRAAAVIQGYRTRDVSFRLFRNEALSQYRSLFDLASRYSYLAARSYDYETGLLGTPAGEDVFRSIVASRALGDLTGGVPRLTTSSIGDGGLASTIAKLNADFDVAEGRLGINNPDRNGTVFSLRTELFRVMQDDSITSDEEAWQQALEQHMVTNLLSDTDVAAHCRNLRNPDGSAVPGILIPFGTTIQHGKNFFGLELAAGDHQFSPSSHATKIWTAGIAFPGYVGMDTYAAGQMQAGAPASSAANALSATPYVYLIPCGSDYMLAPPLGDTNTLRSWNVQDQALPLPFNLGANDFNSTQIFTAAGTLSEQPWITRKHQAFRAVSDPALYYSTQPDEFTSSRLVGRSVWNSRWKLVIPAYSLLRNEQEGLNRFAASVRDVQLYLRTYSHSGN